MGVPDFWLYYLSSRFSQIAQWHIPNSRIPWIQFEKQSILPYHISGILWSKNIPLHKLKSLNLLVSQSLSLWRTYFSKFHLSSTTPINATYLGDPKFPLGLHNTSILSPWISKNLITLSKFITNSRFVDFSSLHSKYQIPNSELCNFLQIRHFYHTQYPLSNLDSPTFYENICLKNPRGKGLISLIYNNLINTTPQNKLPYMLKWENECSLTISLEDWYTSIDNLRKCTRSLTIRETPIKLLTRWYLTPLKLHTIFPSTPSNCFRGCSSPGSFTHIFWDCDKISFIWRQLETFSSKIADTNITLSLSNCLLFSPITNLSIPQTRLIHTISVAIQWLIAVHWKSNSFPVSQLKTRINSIYIMERIFHTIYNSITFHTNKWDPWITHSDIFFSDYCTDV